MVGLPPTDQYELGDDVPFAAAPATVARRGAAAGAGRPRRPEGGRGAGARRGARSRRRARRRACRRSRSTPTTARSAPPLPDARDTFSIVGKRSRADLAGRRRRRPDSAGRGCRPPAPRRARGPDQPDRGRRAERRTSIWRPRRARSTSPLQNQEVARQTLELTRQRFDAGITRQRRSRAGAGVRGGRGARLHQQRLRAQPGEAHPGACSRCGVGSAGRIPARAVGEPRETCAFQTARPPLRYIALA